MLTWYVAPALLPLHVHELRKSQVGGEEHDDEELSFKTKMDNLADKTSTNLYFEG
jgi:hypothetical protein